MMVNVLGCMQVPILQEWKKFATVHECKNKGDGIPVYTIPIILFCDDTSGNRSKKWNKFIVWDLIIAGKQVQLSIQ